MILTSCNKDHLFDCLKSSGKTITAERSIPAFSKIEMENNVDLVFRKAGNYSVKVTAGANLIEWITTVVNDSTLFIKNENKCNWARDFNNEFKVEITTPALVFINNKGSGDIMFEDTVSVYEFRYDNSNASGNIDLKANCDRIVVNIHNGTADLTVRGKAGINFLYYNGYGYMNFKDISTNITYINNQGTGDCRINVKDDLEAQIKHIGNIYYSGNPVNIKSEITGTGLLIHE
ncbi:MAG: head GIN domain-containing protein [Bacteroidia bacterium]